MSGISYTTGHKISCKITGNKGEKPIHRLRYSNMKTTLSDRRHRGERRWGLASAFPLKDSDGITVLTERRSLEERLLMFSGVVPVNAEDKQH
jgi:hypothetical protein